MAIAEGKTFVWHEVYGPSADASIDFYTKALGWSSEEMDMGPMGTYKMLVANGMAVAGTQATAGNPMMEGVPPHWATYIGVDDVDARLEKVKALGGTVLVEPMDIPTVGRMALIQDPQGASVWLFKGEPQG